MGHTTVFVRIGFLGLSKDAIGTTPLEIASNASVADISHAVGKAILAAVLDAQKRLDAETILKHLFEVAQEENDDDDDDDEGTKT
jgi:hypothetical protein